MVLINPIPGQEEENARYLVDNNVAKWIKNDDDIKDILDTLINNENTLIDMKQNISNISKPKSTEEICRIVLSNLDFK